MINFLGEIFQINICIADKLPTTFESYFYLGKKYLSSHFVYIHAKIALYYQLLINNISKVRTIIADTFLKKKKVSLCLTITKNRKAISQVSILFL